MSRILIPTHEFPPFKGGIATVAVGLARGAAAAGHQVRVVAPDYGADNTALDRAEPYAIARFPGSTASVRSIDKMTRFIRLCRRAARRHEADIVHAVDPASVLATAVLGQLGFLRSTFFTVHGTELQQFLRATVLRRLMRRAFRTATLTTAVSHAVHELLEAYFRVPPERAVVAYTGVDPRWLHAPPTDRLATRRRWGARAGDSVLLTVARRVPEKGHDRAVSALASMNEDERRQILYVVVGDGPDDYAERLALQAEHSGVRIRIEGLLSDEELLGAYDAADLFVMLSRPSVSRFEGFGLVYLEAAARGLPSVACETGGVGEAVVDGETGILLSAHPLHEEVASTFRSLLSDPVARAAIGRGARERAGSFDGHRKAAEIYRTFEDALARA